MINIKKFQNALSASCYNLKNSKFITHLDDEFFICSTEDKSVSFIIFIDWLIKPKICFLSGIDIDIKTNALRFFSMIFDEFEVLLKNKEI